MSAITMPVTDLSFTQLVNHFPVEFSNTQGSVVFDEQDCFDLECGLACIESREEELAPIRAAIKRAEEEGKYNLAEQYRMICY